MASNRGCVSHPNKGVTIYPAKVDARAVSAFLQRQLLKCMKAHVTRKAQQVAVTKEVEVMEKEMPEASLEEYKR